jgi:hypothetical protein
MDHIYLYVENRLQGLLQDQKIHEDAAELESWRLQMAGHENEFRQVAEFR